MNNNRNGESIVKKLITMGNFDFEGGKGVHRLGTYCMRWYISSQTPVPSLTGVISNLDVDRRITTPNFGDCKNSLERLQLHHF